MPEKSNFLQILSSGYSREGISYLSRPGEGDFQYPNQEAEMAALVSFNSVLKYAVLQCCKKAVGFPPAGSLTVLTLCLIFFAGKKKLLGRSVDNLAATEINC